MLGQSIADPDGIEGPARTEDGLALLDVATTMQPHKRTRVTSGVCTRSGAQLQGYEIHIGHTTGPDTDRPVATLGGIPEGARNAAGNVEGTYLHGIFANDNFRSAWLESIRTGSAGELNYQASVETALDALADQLEQSIDIDALLNDAQPVAERPRTKTSAPR